MQASFFSAGMYDEVAFRPGKFNRYSIIEWPSHYFKVLINRVKGLWQMTYGPDHVVRKFKSLTYQNVRNFTPYQLSGLKTIQLKTEDGKATAEGLHLVKIMASAFKEDQNGPKDEFGGYIQFRQRPENGRTMELWDEKRHFAKLLEALTMEQVGFLYEHNEPTSSGDPTAHRSFTADYLCKKQAYNSTDQLLKKIADICLFDSVHVIPFMGEKSSKDALKWIDVLPFDNANKLLAASLQMDGYYVQKVQDALVARLEKILNDSNSEAAQGEKLLAIEALIKTIKDYCEAIRKKSGQDRYYSGMTSEQLKKFLPYFSLDQLLDLLQSFYFLFGRKDLQIIIICEIQKRGKEIQANVEKRFADIQTLKDIADQYYHLGISKCVLDSEANAKEIREGIKLLFEPWKARAKALLFAQKEELAKMDNHNRFCVQRDIVPHCTYSELKQHQFDLHYFSALPSEERLNGFRQEADDFLVKCIGPLTNPSEADIALSALTVILERLGDGKFDAKELEKLKKMEFQISPYATYSGPFPALKLKIREFQEKYGTKK